MSASWSRVSFVHLESLRSSGQTQAVPRDRWLPWAHDVQGIRGIWGHGWTEHRPVRSNRSDVVGAVGQAWMIRDDPKDDLPLNAYRYVFVETADGTVWQWGPHSGGSGVSHHLAEMPSWATEPR